MTLERKARQAWDAWKRELEHGDLVSQLKAEIAMHAIDEKHNRLAANRHKKAGNFDRARLHRSAEHSAWNGKMEAERKLALAR